VQKSAELENAMLLNARIRLARSLTILLVSALLACTQPVQPPFEPAITSGVQSQRPRASSESVAGVCRLGAPTVMLREGASDQPGSRLLQYWEMPNDPVWWSEATPDSPVYQDYRRKVAANVSLTDPVRLLQRSPTHNNKIVLAEARNWIRPANCLERLLQAEQHSRLDALEIPTEFLSFVLLSADEKRVRVYFYTVNYDGIGAATPVSAPVVQAREEGWTVLAGLHNHGFHPGQPTLDGILAPSSPDAHFNFNFAAKVGMKEAWITNGIHSAHIPASEFSRFERD
jgi:hypothetical protein